MFTGQKVYIMTDREAPLAKIVGQIYISFSQSGSSLYFLGKRSILAFVSTCRFLLLMCDGNLWLLSFTAVCFWCERAPPSVDALY